MINIILNAGTYLPRYEQNHRYLSTEASFTKNKKNKKKSPAAIIYWSKTWL